MAQQMDDLDAFFNAADSDNPQDIAEAAANVSSPAPAAESRRKKKKRNSKRSSKRKDTPSGLPQEELDALVGEENPPAGKNLKGKFIAVDSGGRGGAGEPFILIPAHISSYIPRWGWAAIAAGLLMLIVGVILMPAWSLDRLASRLGDGNAADAQQAMRSLVLNGDARTVNKLYDMAASGGEPLTARLRAVDAMGLINVPEADRSLLRLELAGGTDEQVREAAIAARKQREAARTRGQR